MVHKIYQDYRITPTMNDLVGTGQVDSAWFPSVFQAGGSSLSFLLASVPSPQHSSSSFKLLKSIASPPSYPPPPRRGGLVFLQMFVFSAADENIHYLVSCAGAGSADLHFSQLIRVAQAEPVTRACSPPPPPLQHVLEGFSTLQTLPLSPLPVPKAQSRRKSKGAQRRPSLSACTAYLLLGEDFCSCPWLGLQFSLPQLSG